MAGWQDGDMGDDTRALEHDNTSSSGSEEDTVLYHAVVPSWKIVCCSVLYSSVRYGTVITAVVSCVHNNYCRNFSTRCAVQCGTVCLHPWDGRVGWSSRAP